MLTLNILNWHRATHLKHMLSVMSHYDVVQAITVWNNRVEHPFEYDDPKVFVLNPSRDMGLNAKRMCGVANMTECTLAIDDDTLLSEKQVEELYEHWQDDSDIIHGFFARRPKEDNTYSVMHNNKDMEVEIVIGRVACYNTTYNAAALKTMGQYPKLCAPEPGSDKFFHEDIFFNYVVRDISGRLNRVHHTSDSLPGDIDNKGVWNRPGHHAERTIVMHRMQKHFGIM